jgi:putative transposase
MSNFANSYTRYFNTKNNRLGPIFQGKFKAVRIESNDQLLHVSRYIHLNPYTSYIVKNLEQIKKYPYSSLLEYLTQSKTNFYEKEIILTEFKNNLSYWNFLANHADYQRNLEKIKHLILEE